MAVDGVKGNTNADTTQRQAEEYRNREAEQKKANEAQLKRIKKENEAKLKAQSQKHNETLSAVRNESNRILSAKDKEYQNEINELNRMNRNLSRKAAMESERNAVMSNDRAKETAEHVNDSKNQQIVSMKENYEAYIQKQEEGYNEEHQRLRDKVQTDLAKERNQIVEKNEDDRREAELNRRRDVAAVQRAKDIQRRQKDMEIEELKKKNQMDRRVLTEKFTSTLNNIQDTNTNRQKTQKEGFDFALEEMREEAHQNHGKLEQQYANSLANLRDDTNRRTENQINRLETSLAQAKYARTEDTVKAQQANRLEREKIMDQVRHRQEVMEDQRLRAVADSNATNNEAIQRMAKKNSDLISDQAAFYKEKMNSTDLIRDQQARQQSTEFEATIAAKENSSKINNEKIKMKFQMEKREMEERFRSLVSQMRRNHAEHVLNVKNKSMREQTELMANMEKTLKENEVKNEKKLADSIQKYETRIADLTLRGKADIVKERETADERVKATEGFWDQKLTAQQAQYENQIAQLKEKSNHQEEQNRKRLEKLQADMVRSGKA